MANPRIFNSIPRGQSWLYKRMNKLGHVEESGVCFGISHMAIQALHSDDPEKELEIFDKRLELIAAIPEEKFDVEIAKLRKEYSDLSKLARKEFLQIHCLSDESLAEMNEVERLKWQKTINAAIQKKLKQWAEEGKIDLIKLEIPALFDGIELYQNPQRHGYLFPKEELVASGIEEKKEEEKTPQTRPIFQNAILTFPVVLSKKLEQKTMNNPLGIVPGGDFSGAYTLKDLNIYFSTLATSIHENALNAPLTLVLNSVNHAITISYDPKTQTWLFIDPNRLPTKRFKQSNEIAKMVMKAMSFKKKLNDVICFSTQIFAPLSQYPSIQNMLSSNETQKTWKAIPPINATNAKLVDPEGGFLLMLAARNNQVELAETLLEQGAVVDEEYKGITALYRAVRLGNLKVVEALLNAGAQVNKVVNGFTYLHYAADAGEVEVMKVLLAHGAEKDAICNSYTPLFGAVNEGRIEAVQVLLDAGVEKDKMCNGLTPLHLAVKNGHAGVVTVLLAHQVNINQICEGLTPLFLAAREGHLEIMEILLAHGAIIGEKCNGLTLLEIAVQNGHTRVVEALIAKGAKIDESLLKVAVEKGHMGVVEALVIHGAKIDGLFDGETLLHIAAKKGGMRVVKAMLDRNIKIDTVCNGITPLFLAASEGHLHVMNRLVAEGAKLDEKCNGISLLQIAVQKGHADVVQALIANKANIKEKYQGFTLLQLALQSKHMDVVEVLIANGAIPDELYQGYTLLHLAARLGHVGVVKQMLALGGGISRTCVGETPLLLAAAEGHANIVKILLAAGANKEQLPRDGFKTPLFVAVENGHADVVNVLLDAKADVNKQCNNTTPLFKAAQQGSLGIVNKLLQLGANVNEAGNMYIESQKDFVKVSPLYVAIKNGHFDIVKTLLMSGAKPDEHCMNLLKEKDINKHMTILIELACTYSESLESKNSNSTSREQASKKYYQECLKADSLEELIEIQKLFNQLDNYATNLSKIPSYYKPDNPHRIELMKNLMEAVNDAYEEYAKGEKDPNNIIRDLFNKATQTGLDANNEHGKTSNLSMLYQSRLNSYIQEIPKPEFKNSEAANDSVYDADEKPNANKVKTSKVSSWSPLTIWCNTDGALAETVNPPEALNNVIPDASASPTMGETTIHIENASSPRKMSN